MTAQTLVQLLQVLQVIGIKNIGKAKLFDIINEIFRLSGAYDLKLEIPEGEETLAEEETEAILRQFAAALQTLQQQAGASDERISANEAHVAKLVEALQKLIAAQPTNQLESNQQ